MSIFYQNRQEQFRLFLSRNNTFSLHLHRQAEGIFVMSGSIQVTVEHETRLFREGEYFFIFPYQLHSLSTPSHSSILLFIFDASFCPSFEPVFSGYLPVFQPVSLGRLSPYGLQAFQNLQELWPGERRDTAAESAENLEGSPALPRRMLLTEGYMQILLAESLPGLSLTPRRTSPEDLELSQRILLYIEKHYTEDLSLDTLAARFRVSRFTVSRIFSEKLRISFSACLNSRRLEHTRRLLQSSSLSVTEIAYEAGFSSTRTFFRAFGKEYGITPKQYRLELLAGTGRVSPPTAAR